MIRSHPSKSSNKAPQVHPALSHASIFRRAQGNKMMVMKTKDIPADTEETPAMRLREAREGLGLSRAELARMTGIPAKSIEKFEYGSQEPSLSRVQVLAEALEVTSQWIMGEEQTAPKTTKAQPLPSNQNDQAPMQKGLAPTVREMLEQLDDMRTDEFDGVQRQAMALADRIRAALKVFEPDELLALADERGLYKDECENEITFMIDVFKKDPHKAQAYCGSVEERIIDTAILGLDLYNIDRDALVELADQLQDEHDIEKPGVFGLGWGKHKGFVPLIRPYVQAQALSGNGFNFDELGDYPIRQQE